MLNKFKKYGFSWRIYLDVSNNQDLKGKESVSDASNVISLKFSPNKNNDTFTENGKVETDLFWK